VLRLRGAISRDVPWDVMVDLYFYRDPETEEKEEEEKKALAAQQIVVPAAAPQAEYVPVDEEWGAPTDAYQIPASMTTMAEPAPAPQGFSDITAPPAQIAAAAAAQPVVTDWSSGTTTDWAAATPTVADWGGAGNENWG
jgi:small subunit ribosomal protein SAe